MYFYRMAGALIIAFSGFSFAYIMNSSASEKASQTEALLELMRFIRVQIECFALPASEIILRCDKKLLEKCGAYSEILPSGFDALFESFSIEDSEAESIMRGFAAGFGKSYREEQLKECDYYIGRLEECSRRICEDLPKRKKVNSALCISSALAIIILLV